MPRRLNLIDRRLAAKTHILQVVRIQAADAIGWMIQKEMAAQVGRVTQLVRRAAGMNVDWTPKRITWLKTQIDEGFAILMDEGEDSFRRALQDFAVESYDWARTLLIKTLPRWYFRNVVPIVLAGEATAEPVPITPKKIIIPKQVFDKYVAPALEVDDYREPAVDSPPMSDREWEAYAKEVIFPPLTRWVIETIAESDQWRKTFPGNKSKFNDPHFRDQLVEGIASGENVEELTGRIRDLESGVYWKARRTARTESLRVAEMAQRETWDDLGGMLAGVQILAVLDQNTRPEHAARNGTIYAERPQAGELPMDELPGLPDEPNCALPGQFVVGEVVAASKAFYSGKAFEFTCLSGRSCTVTANHPVLTDRGFIRAADVRKGDNLVCNFGQCEGLPVSTHNKEQPPALIEDVFCSIEKSGRVFRAEPMPFDFHGDAEFFQGDVDVVAVHGALLGNAEPASTEFVSQVLLPKADIGLAGESAFRSGGPVDRGCGGVFFAAPRSPSVAELPCDELGVGLHFSPLDSLLIGLGTDDRAVFDQVLREAESVSAAVSQSAAGNAEFLSDLIDRFPGIVAFDEVSNVREFQYSGHVYDLQAVQGVYFLGGLIVHNCRCFTVPVLVPPDEVASDPGFTALLENASGENIPDPAAYDKWFNQADDGARRLAAGTRRYNDMATRLDGVRAPEWSDFIDPQTGSLMGRNELQRETDAARNDRKVAVTKLFREREALLRQVAAKGYIAR